ncbi:PIG-X [Xylariales sp. PMI_506]|nr:PIG-X [Xylariales sp. PMI_506]
MRQRTTLFHHNDDAIEPKSVKVKGRTISGPDITAVREDRFIISLAELPQELQELLRATQELHIRWSSPTMHKSIGPYNSRLPPGVHIFYTPQSGHGTNSSDPICSFLETFIPSGGCSSSLEFFSLLSRDESSRGATYQGYFFSGNLSQYHEHAAGYICTPSDNECKQRVRELERARSIDFSHETGSDTVKITVVGDHKKQSLTMTASENHRLEVGLLTPNIPGHLEAHELGVTGLLTVLGEYTEPKPTMFSFAARHKTSGSVFSSEFKKPLGLHPTLKLSIDSNKPPIMDETCSLYAYFTLPRTIFADRYQLEDPLFLTSKNLTALRYISEPVDLEAPDYVMKIWGSALLLELELPSSDQAEPFTAEVPLHLRYQAPRAGGTQDFQVPYPALFWACDAEEGALFSGSPFDRVDLGYDGLFGPETLFWHLDPIPQSEGSPLVLTDAVPVLDLGKSSSISLITGVTVLAGFVWVVWKLLAVYLRAGYAAPLPQDEKLKKKQ